MELIEGSSMDRVIKAARLERARSGSPLPADSSPSRDGRAASPLAADSRPASKERRARDRAPYQRGEDESKGTNRAKTKSALATAVADNAAGDPDSPRPGETTTSLQPGAGYFEHRWSRAFLRRMEADPNWPAWIKANAHRPNAE
jgi:hypothetical protein